MPSTYPPPLRGGRPQRVVSWSSLRPGPCRSECGTSLGRGDGVPRGVVLPSPPSWLLMDGFPLICLWAPAWHSGRVTRVAGPGSCGNSEILGECWDQSPGPKAAVAGLGQSPQTCPCSCLTLPHGWPAPMPPERIVLTFFQMITEALETCHQQHRNVTITSVRPPPPRPRPQSRRSSYLFCPLHPGCLLSHRHEPLT